MKGGKFIMIAKLTNIGTRLWEVIGFILPLLKGIGELANWLEELEPEDGEKYGEEEKNIVIKIVLIIYDIVNELTEEELPLPKATLEKYLGNLIDVVVQVYNLFNIFN